MPRIFLLSAELSSATLCVTGAYVIRLAAELVRSKRFAIAIIISVAVAGGIAIFANLHRTRLTDPQLIRFVLAKKEQAKALARLQNAYMPRKVWALFDAVLADDWATAEKLHQELRLETRLFGGTLPPPNIIQRTFHSLDQLLIRLNLKVAKSNALQTSAWQPINETACAYFQFKFWTGEFLERFSNDVLAVVPADSIYFGSDDPGRFLISERVESQIEGHPFFVLTQNQLSDAGYRDYLEQMYGRKLRVLLNNDVFTAYLEAAARRLETGTLKPGEIVSTNGGITSVTGQASLMELCASLVKMIFDKNPEREVYIQQTWPLDWMYPHLSPAGPIFKVNREALSELSEEIVERDRQYWGGLIRDCLGDWFRDETSFDDICEFFKNFYFATNNIGSFPGNKKYPQDRAAWITFGQSRTAIADLYT